MTEREFIFWLRGYLSAKPDSSIKGDVLYMLNQIEEKKINYTGTITDSYKEAVKWANNNSDIWFNNKFGINGSADHLS